MCLFITQPAVLATGIKENQTKLQMSKEQCEEHNILKFKRIWYGFRELHLLYCYKNIFLTFLTKGLIFVENRLPPPLSPGR